MLSGISFWMRGSSPVARRDGGGDETGGGPWLAPGWGHPTRPYGFRVAALLALLLIVGLVAVQLVQPISAQAAVSQNMVTFPGTITPLIAHSHLNQRANASQRISLSIGLRPSRDVTSYVQDILRPGSANYHRFLTAAQYEGVFSPGKATYNALQQFLRSSGFTITSTYNHRLLIGFRGTIAQVEQAFHVTINTYTTSTSYTYYANANDPSLPAWLAGEVQSINGLNNATRWQHAPLPKHSVLTGTAAPHTITCPAPGTGYLTSNQTASAYKLSNLYNAHFQGEGQAIALFELDTFVMSDLTNYASCYGHSHTPIQTFVTGTGTVPTDDGVAEVELDAELVLSAAPQLGRLSIYEAANNAADYLAEWAQIVQDAVPVVSTSWGQCEQLAGSQLIQQENVLFTAAAAQGQSIFAASGDSGSAGCAFNGDGSIKVVNAGDPGAQPFVTGVGGTTLSLSGTSNYGSEAVWNNLPDPSINYSGGASGGGISQYWPAPVWQSAPGVTNVYSTGTLCNASSGNMCRETPDVSLSADPSNGYLVYCTSAAAHCSSTSPWIAVGGTSAAAPMWAAMMALTNEMSLQQGGFNIGFVNPLLYQVASNATMYASSFNDISTGKNDFNNLNGGKYPATSGYDLATGLGSYNAFNLATNLVTLAQRATGTRTSPVGTTWYFAEGSVGGGFQEYITLQNPSATQDDAVTITYLFESKAAVNVSHTVSKSSRATVSVNADLNIQATAPQQAISAIVHVTSGPGVVTERPMYFSHNGIQSGTDVVGATTPGKSYYFPVADTRQDSTRTYRTYITMLNPSATQSATTTITYYTGSCGQTAQPVCPTQNVVIPPLHRGTATPLASLLFQQVSVNVQSDQPIVVERPTYFVDNIPTAGGVTTGATSEVGASTPGNDWLFAEGYTGNNFQEYLVLANFASASTTANIKLEYKNGHTQTVGVTVPAFGQFYFDVDQANKNPSGTCDTTPCQTTPETSAEVTSVAPIVVDRLMYFHYSSVKYSGATETVGEAGPAQHSVYAFAEGYTANTFQEYLTLQNPTTNDETVAVTFFADTYVLQEQVVVKAHSRQTVPVNPQIVPIAQAYNNMGPDSYAVSLSVQALGSGSKIVSERPMYFNYHGDQGGTNVLGYTG